MKQDIEVASRIEREKIIQKQSRPAASERLCKLSPALSRLVMSTTNVV